MKITVAHAFFFAPALTKTRLFNLQLMVCGVFRGRSLACVVWTNVHEG